MKKNTESIMSLEKIVGFVNDLIKQYNEQKINLSLDRKEFFLKLDILNDRILKTEDYKINNKNAFSPYGQEIKEEKYKIKDLYKEAYDIKKEINYIDSEIDKVNEGIRYLSEISTMIKAISNSRLSYYDKKHILYNNIGLYLLDMQEKDRQRISMDLHDSTVQTLTGMLHRIELSSRLIDIDTVRAKLELSTLSNTLKTVINEMREIIFDLSPMPLDKISLVETVKSLAHNLGESYSIKINIYKENEEPDDLLSVIRVTLFRVIQEAFLNVVKHSKADEINLKISFKDDMISIVITDNGIGFDVDYQQNKIQSKSSGFGIVIMKKRVCLLSGKFKVESRINEGTKIIISVPLVENKGEYNEHTN